MLRDGLIRHAKDDGTLLPKTSHPTADLATIFRITQEDEHRIFVEAVQRLLLDGYLSHSRGRLFIRNFEPAQEKTPSYEAAKKRKQRDKNKGNSAETHDDGPGTDGGHAPGQTSGHGGESRDSVPRETNRNETNRNETNRVGDKSPKVVDDRSEVFVPCPADLWAQFPLPSRATLEVAMIPIWAQSAICVGYVAGYQAKPGERRTVPQWHSGLVKAIQSTWNDPRRRPKQPGTVGANDDRPEKPPHPDGLKWEGGEFDEHRRIWVELYDEKRGVWKWDETHWQSRDGRSFGV